MNICLGCRLLTGAVEEVSKSSGLNERFLGLIVLPIAGNACEHITAIFVAVKNKMDLAIGVALGSSIQASAVLFPARHHLEVDLTIANTALPAAWTMSELFCRSSRGSDAMV